MTDANVNVSADVQPAAQQEQPAEAQLSVNQKVEQIHTLLTPFMESVSGVLQRSEAAAADVTKRLDALEQKLEQFFARANQNNTPAPAPAPAPEPAPADQTVPATDQPAAPADSVPPATEQGFPAPPVEQPANPAAVPAEDQPEVRSDAVTVDPEHTAEVIQGSEAP